MQYLTERFLDHKENEEQSIFIVCEWKGHALVIGPIEALYFLSCAKIFSQTVRVSGCSLLGTVLMLSIAQKKLETQ